MSNGSIKPLPTPVVIMGRIGYVSKGVVYVLVGILVMLLAFGERNQVDDSAGALRYLANKWYGELMVYLIAFGLLFYALWKFLETCYDPSRKGSGGKGMLKRAGSFIKGLLALLLAAEAFYIVASNTGTSGGSSSSSSSNPSSSKKDWTAKLMSYKVGIVIVFILGIVAIWYGFYNAYRVCTGKFLHEKLDTASMSSDQQSVAKHVGRFGYSFMAINYLLIGSFLISAAQRSNSNDAANAGFGKTLRTLQQQQYGRFLLALFAIGVIGYGIFKFFAAKYSPVFTHNKSKHHHSTGNPIPGDSRV